MYFHNREPDVLFAIIRDALLRRHTADGGLPIQDSIDFPQEWVEQQWSAAMDDVPGLEQVSPTSTSMDGLQRPTFRDDIFPYEATPSPPLGGDISSPTHDERKGGL